MAAEILGLADKIGSLQVGKAYINQAQFSFRNPLKIEIMIMIMTMIHLTMMTMLHLTMMTMMTMLQLTMMIMIMTIQESSPCEADRD